MLGMNTYTKDYIAACRARVDADLRAYRKHREVLFVRPLPPSFAGFGKPDDS